MTIRELDRVRRVRELSSLRVVAVVRLGVVALMVFALDVGVAPRWREQAALLLAYGIVAVVAVAVAFSRAGLPVAATRLPFLAAIVDVTAIFVYKMLAPAGAYLPLLVMTLLPVMVVLEVSSRRAVVLLTAALATFAVEVFGDPDLVPILGWGKPTLVVVLYAFLCVTAATAVIRQERHIDEIARLTVSREALVAETMRATDDQQRRISEFIHDGPLQHVLAARQDIAGHAKSHPAEPLDRAITSLRTATGQLRDATFELHPSVLEQAGLAEAVNQLAGAAAKRSGIAIGTDLDYAIASPIDPMVFGAARELLSNVTRHSGATTATVTLQIAGSSCRLDVADDGVGLSEDRAAQRLAEGHIGLASQRARIEAAGGSLTMLPASSGTHVRVVLPLRRDQS